MRHLIITIVTICLMITSGVNGKIAPEDVGIIYQVEVPVGIAYVLRDRISFDSSLYEPLIEDLNNAKEGDIIYIVLKRNHGGAVVTMDLITKAMTNSKATVYTSVVKFADSAAAQIAAHGDYLVLTLDDKLLWHLGSISNGIWSTRIDADFRDSWDPSKRKLYWEVLKSNSYVYDPSYLQLPGGGSIVNPFSRTFVTKEVWEYIKSGHDKWVSARDVCYNRGGLFKLIEFESSNKCVLEGLK